MTKLLSFLLGFLALPLAASELPESDLPPVAPVVILGEVHDNPHHHAWQGAVLTALRPAAVVFEMLTPDQAARIAPDLREDPDALAEAIGWADSGWPDFALYRPVFAALGDARVYGAALPYDAVRAAVSEGAAAQFAGDAARFGLDQDLPEDQQATRELLQAEAHCNALPEMLLSGMVEAQRLRDAGFAETVLQALEDTGGPVVLITGNGHARVDWAVPHMLSLAAPGLEVLSIAQLEEGQETEDLPFDHWRVTEAAERDDPCAGFATN
jgi:uncharacterized iron-regulated protein